MPSRWSCSRTSRRASPTSSPRRSGCSSSSRSSSSRSSSSTRRRARRWRRGNEDLARIALERKQFAQTELQTLDQQVVELEQQQQGLIDKEQKLRSKLEQFRTKKEVIKAQYSAAEAQVKISEAATGVGEEMADVGMAMQRAVDKTEGMRARASAMDELEAAGAFDDNLSLTAGQDDIDRQLAELTSGSQVDDDLAQDEGRAGPGLARRRRRWRRASPPTSRPRAASSDRPDLDGGPVPAAGRRRRAPQRARQRGRRRRRGRRRGPLPRRLRGDARPRPHATGSGSATTSSRSPT